LVSKKDVATLYSNSQQIGQGASGTIVKVTHKERNEVVAIKKNGDCKTTEKGCIN